MNERIIEDLYYGCIEPYSKAVIKGSEYSKVNSLFVRLADELNEKLNDDEQKLFQKVIDSIMELNSIDNLEKFTEGFKLGLRLTAESFIDKSNNLKDIE